MTPPHAVVGLSATVERTVAATDTAASVGSGTLEVLGTPRLLAWCEVATCSAIAPALESGETSVGTLVWLEHLAPSAVGATVQVTACAVGVEGRLVRFGVTAHEGEKLLGTGEVTRVVVDVERFLSGIKSGS